MKKIKFQCHFHSLRVTYKKKPMWILTVYLSMKVISARCIHKKPQHTTQNNNKQTQSLMVSAWYSNSTTAAIARKTFKSLYIKYEYISSGRVDCKISIIWAAFQSLKTKVKAEKPDNKQQLQVAAVRSQVSITEVEKIHWLHTKNETLWLIKLLKHYSFTEWYLNMFQY